MDTLTITSDNNQPIPPSKRFFFAYAFPWVFILLGGAALFFSIRELELARQSAHWIAIPGTVQSSSIKWTDQNNSTSNSTSHTPSYIATANVFYSYAVDGRTYTSNRVMFGDYGSGDASHADSIVRQYMPGQAVTVYFDPLDYSQAVLRPGVRMTCYLFPLLGLVFMLAGGAMLWWLPSLLNQASNSDSVTMGGDGPLAPTS